MAWGFGLRVLGLGCWLLRVLGLGFWAWGFGFRVLGVRFEVKVLWFWFWV